MQNCYLKWFILDDIYSKICSVDVSNIADKDLNFSIVDDRSLVIDFLSYFVGCLFGRYSIDNYQFCYAGKEDQLPDNDMVDKDGIVPITDEPYFKDDIVVLLEKFIGKVFGEEQIQENMEYIARCISSKNDGANEVIRQYFLKFFMKDHLQKYQKKPIYWMFDSGKENGFKCLIYLHRYTKDTVGLIRTDYLVNTQNVIENALKNAEYTITTSSSAVDRAQATKKRDKYIKQFAEIRTYYQALSHVAQQRIELDLDDGVKTNYAKFQGIEVSIEGGKKQTINLLTKI